MPELLRLRSLAEPDAVALVVDGGPALTYRQWEDRSGAVARALAQRGVAHGDRVLLVFDNHRWTDFAVSYVGVLEAGATAVPASPRLTSREVTAIAGHCGARVIVAPPDLVPEAWSGPVVDPADVDGDGGAGPLPQVTPGDLAEILYTSGTTGAPKGVACSHENILGHDLPSEPGREAPSRASFVHAFPIGTNAGQEVLRLPLRRGDRTAIVLPVFDPCRLCALVAEHRVRRLQLVPAMGQLLVASGALGRHDVSSLERVTLSSAPAPPRLFARLAEALPGVSLWNAYALTEAGGARTLAAYDPNRPACVGFPVGETEVKVVDGAGDLASAGEVGDIWLRRRATPTRWYYRDPQATSTTFVDGWVRTGDVGYLDEHGALYLVDRRSDLIISGGANVSSVEVENVLYEHPSVSEAAVFPWSHPVLGEDVAAAVVLHETASPASLQAFVRERLAEHKTPHRLFFVETLPRNASGKVLKRELRERLEGESVATDQRLPGDSVEQAIAAIWQEVLGLQLVGVDDDFFDCGGHSLASAQIMARLVDRFQVELPVSVLFEAPTVAQLAEVVRHQRARESLH